MNLSRGTWGLGLIALLASEASTAGGLNSTRLNSTLAPLTPVSDTSALTAWLGSAEFSDHRLNSTLAPLTCNGATDANHGFTPLPTSHKTHDLGMVFDLGVSNYIDNSSTGAQFNENEALTLDSTKLKATWIDGSDHSKGTLYDNIPDKTAYDNRLWNLDNARYLAGLLPATQTSDDKKNDQDSALKDFLSLYTVTQRDAITGNGTWEELPVRNGEAARAALFGTGTKSGALISEVYVGGNADLGQNPYHNMNDLLDRLGIKSSPIERHQNHFHIYLRPPTVRSIDTLGPSWRMRW